jgi:hypothetical protein
MGNQKKDGFLINASGDHRLKDMKMFMGDDLPNECLDYFKKEDTEPFEYGGCWILAYHNKDKSQWVLVTDNAEFYKVGAEFMIWFPLSKPMVGHTVGGKAYWSGAQLKKNINNLLTAGSMEIDPGYQT